jgi:peptidoglycan hydrolase-like protein with peptidoglycan-binding domain
VSRIVRLGSALLAVAVVGGGGWWVAQSGAAAGRPAGTSPDGAEQTERSTAAVERRTLTITEDLDATLGFDGEYAVLGGLPGTLTSTAAIGSVVTNGKRLYEVDGKHRAYLMYGTRPAWRTLEPGMSNGPDVRQLENNLKALGFTRRGDKIDTRWDSRTTAAVKRWQRSTGQKADGTIELGEVVFLPEAIRVTEIVATPGTAVGPGAPIVHGTSNRRVVSLDLDASERELLAPEMAVDIELPDGSVVAGTVAEIGRIAESSSDQQGGSTTTLPVTIVLDDPAAGGDLDSAPVTVTVVRSTREDVLTVPVTALIALLEGGYAVEVVNEGVAEGASPAASPDSSGSAPSAGPATHLVRVEPGLFDRGVVEITADLEPGTLVVVPS